ncbi:hypothetical protein T492DRAFT_428310 [Pavlovales sp. CCMP2436]|nr:hypothetical protein T492DRAFT_428310 [Pavlovales sp. CCMP2436]
MARTGGADIYTMQDRVVAAIFDNKQSGYFVDLAANHPIYLSNTRTLERDFGWQGLCIDGNAELLNELARHRTCTVGSVVAAEKDSSITFRKFRAANWQTNRSAWEHGLSGIVSSGTDNKPSWRQWLFGQSKPSVDVDVVDEVAQATTLVNVLSSFGMPNSGIDYLSLDVEGAEWEVLKMKYKFEISVCVCVPYSLPGVVIKMRRETPTSYPPPIPFPPTATPRCLPSCSTTI